MSAAGPNTNTSHCGHRTKEFPACGADAKTNQHETPVATMRGMISNSSLPSLWRLRPCRRARSALPLLSSMSSINALLRASAARSIAMIYSGAVVRPTRESARSLSRLRYSSLCPYANDGSFAGCTTYLIMAVVQHQVIGATHLVCVIEYSAACGADLSLDEDTSISTFGNGQVAYNTHGA